MGVDWNLYLIIKNKPLHILHCFEMTWNWAPQTAEVCYKYFCLSCLCLYFSQRRKVFYDLS